MTVSLPPLSVVIATTQPWPQLHMVLESLGPQVRALGAEVIVGDGHGQALPHDHGFPNVRVVRRPGASVFQLRALAFDATRADLIAGTEDHCRVAADWCEARGDPRVASHHADPVLPRRR